VIAPVGLAGAEFARNADSARSVGVSMTAVSMRRLSGSACAVP